MAKKKTVEEILDTLGQRVCHGHSVVDPVSDETLAKIREAVAQQWDERHPGKATIERAEDTDKGQELRSEQERGNSQSGQAVSNEDDQGHDQEH